MESVIQYIFSTNQAFYPLLARIVSGMIILPYGLQKLGLYGGPGITATLEDFKKRKLPTVIAWLVIICQSLGSLGLIIGFCTRIAAAGSIIIFTAAIFVHLPDGWMMNWYNRKKGEGVEYFFLLLALLWIALIYGGGAWSIDNLISTFIFKQQ